MLDKRCMRLFVPFRSEATAGGSQAGRNDAPLTDASSSSIHLPRRINSSVREITAHSISMWSVARRSWLRACRVFFFAVFSTTRYSSPTGRRSTSGGPIPVCETALPRISLSIADIDAPKSHAMQGSVDLREWRNGQGRRLGRCLFRPRDVILVSDRPAAQAFIVRDLSGTSNV